ncbi:MAG: carbon-nitrogen family hydrolase [Firmicutes bacterium]|nr:carbon-nitrogen family hydrolase [Bacillota bacterium]
MKIKAAAIQFDILPAQVEHNMERARELLADAIDRGAELLILPELWNTGYALEDIAELAPRHQASALAMLRELASGAGVTIVGGSIPEDRHGAVYNTCFVIGPKGQTLAKYRKAHLFPHYKKEHLYFTAGDELVSFDYEKAGERINVGLCICYDLRFPEMCRNLALRGARLLCAPTSWPRARIREYELLCRARATENRAFVLATNYTDTVDNTYCGGALVAAPDGELLVRGENYEGVYMAEMDFAKYRDSNFESLADRVPFIDEIDNNLL